MVVASPPSRFLQKKKRYSPPLRISWHYQEGWDPCFLWPFPISILDSCYIRINPLSLSIYQSKPAGMNVPPTKCGRFECRRKKRVRRVGQWWSFIPFVTLSMMIISLLSCWWWSSYLCYLVDDEWWMMMPLLKEILFPKPERLGQCLLWSGETSRWLCLPTEEKSKKM